MDDFEVDEQVIKELAGAIEAGDRDEAFQALDTLVRDHDQADTIRHWIACARTARTYHRG